MTLPTMPSSAHWLGKRSSPIRLAENASGCVLYFETEVQCADFLAWVEATANLVLAYEFDRYVGGFRMAEGARIHHAGSEQEALEKARALFTADASPGEMEMTTFKLRVARSDGETLQNPVKAP